MQQSYLLIPIINTIADVMEAVGYSDMSTFYKAFNSYYNDSPANYRSKYQKRQ